MRCVVDVVVCITGKTSQNAIPAIDEVVKNRDDMCHEITRVNLVDSLGRRHQALQPVADIQTLLRVIVQLPCRNLSALKREICEVFLQFMGGDLSLIPELQANHAHQQARAQESSHAPNAAFGEYVRATRPPPLRQ